MSKFTGHRKVEMPDGSSLIKWVRPTIADEARRFNVPMPTDAQIALVISSMRMHHIITHAAAYDFSELGQPSKVTEFWPIESSIGRYFRDAGGQFLERRDV